MTKPILNSASAVIVLRHDELAQIWGRIFGSPDPHESQESPNYSMTLPSVFSGALTFVTLEPSANSLGSKVTNQTR